MLIVAIERQTTTNNVILSRVRTAGSTERPSETITEKKKRSHGCVRNSVHEVDPCPQKTR